MEERTSEIYNKIQKKKLDAAKEAEEAENKQEQLWREQGKPVLRSNQPISFWQWSLLFVNVLSILQPIILCP